MATCRVSETGEAMCYLWTTIICVGFGIVCFTVGSTYKAFEPIGITLMLFACLFFVLFFLRRRRRDSEGSNCCLNVLCCKCCCGRDDQCDRCLTAMLCLKKQEPEVTAMEAQNRLNQLTSSGHLSQYDDCVPQGTVSRASRWPQLRTLHKGLQTLQREYQYLERYPEILPDLEECYMGILRQEEILSEWMSGRDTPMPEDVKAMRRTLSSLKQQLRHALVAAERNYSNRGTIQVPSISERVELAAADIPQPPPYTEYDPMDPAVRSGFSSESNSREASVLLSPVDAGSSRHQYRNEAFIEDQYPTNNPQRHTSDYRPHRNVNPDQYPSNQHQHPQAHAADHRRHRHVNPAAIEQSYEPTRSSQIPVISHQTQQQGLAFPEFHMLQAPSDGQDNYVLEAPQDETDAPPTYEEAVSSTV